MDRRQFLSSLLVSSVAALAARAAERSATAAPFAAPSRAGNAHRASVTDFGADPTGVADATAAVRRAVASLAQNDARLVFPPGRYRFAPSDTAVLQFRTGDGLEIFGNGAELVFSGSFASAPAPLIDIAQCTNVEIHDLKIDWARPPFSQGEILSVEDHALLIAIDPEFPVDGSEPVSALAEYDFRDGLPARDGVVASGVVASVLPAGPRRLRLNLRSSLPLRKGARIVLLHSAAAPPCIRLRACSTVLLESVALYAASGDGALLEGCRDITLDDVRAVPRPGSGRQLSLCGTGARFTDCQGAITVKRSQFTGTGGGGIALHQSYWRIADRLDDRTVLVAGAGGRPLASWQLPEAGSILQISRASDLELLGEIAVASAADTPAGTRLSFAETLSSAVGPGALLCNALGQPRASVDHSLFSNHLGTSIAGHGRMRVTNSRFSAASGSALFFAASPASLEGPAVGSVTVADNTFSACNRAHVDRDLRRGTVTVGQISPPARVNQGVSILHNVFSEDGGPAIDCVGLSWLTVENNTFGPADTLAALGSPAQAILLRNVDQSFIDANQSQTPQQIALIDCTDTVKATANGRLTQVRQS